MIKFYTFKAGSRVPGWMVSTSNKNNHGEFKNRSGKIVFGTSCVVSRYFKSGYKLMPIGNKYTEMGGIFISGFDSVNIDFNGAFTPTKGQKVSHISIEGGFNG